mmetsp:Transcript_12327/g.15008  ORF Transcript_12327/g.15008 Transcript_12327/m.15008 type:complete len:83 (-) Transcript_12327:1026-1274(-)
MPCKIQSKNPSTMWRKLPQGNALHHPSAARTHLSKKEGGRCPTEGNYPTSVPLNSGENASSPYRRQGPEASCRCRNQAVQET